MKTDEGNSKVVYSYFVGLFTGLVLMEMATLPTISRDENLLKPFRVKEVQRKYVVPNKLELNVEN